MLRRGFQYFYAIIAAAVMLFVGFLLFALVILPLFIYVGSVFLPR